MAGAPAGAVETGAPAFVVIDPAAMGLSSVPTDLRFLPDGRIVAAAKNEIVIGDGVRWEVYRAVPGHAVPGPLIIVDRDGKIYTGVEGGVARIDLVDDARFRLTKVADFNALKVQTLGAILVTPIGDDWCWYAGSDAIVSWRPGRKPRILAHGTAIECVFRLDQNIYFSNSADGSISMATANGTVSPILNPGNIGNAVTCAIPFADDQLLTGSIARGLQFFDGHTFRPFSGAPLLGKSRRIHDICPVSDGYFAAVIDAVGVAFFDREGHVVQTLDRRLDHRLGRTKRVRYDQHGVVWLVLSDGVARVEFPSAASHFAPLIASGLEFAQVIRFEGKLWVLSEGHATRGVYDSTGRLEYFEDDTPTGGFLFTLAETDNRLWASNDLGLFVYENSKWRLALPGLVNARVGFASPTARGIPYIARGEYGFIQREGDNYIVRRYAVDSLADNYNAVADRDGVAWLELGVSRIGRLDFRAESPKLELFGPSAGLTNGWPEIYVLEGMAHFRIFNDRVRFDAATRRFVPDDVLARQFPLLAKAKGRPLIDALGRLWYTADGRVYVADQEARAGSAAPYILAMAGTPYEFAVEESGIAWIHDNQRLERVDLKVAPPPAAPLRAVITSVQLTATNRWIIDPADQLAPFSYGENALVFHLAAPANPFAGPVQFEVLLEGAGREWATTGTLGSAAFTRLKEGQYTLHVRPVVAGHAPGAEARLQFTVLPPWYRTRLAWTLYVLSAIGLVAFAAWLSAYLQRLEKRRLEKVVVERTRELNASNQQLARQIDETTEKALALAISEDRYRTLNADLEGRVTARTAELSASNAEIQRRESLFRLIFEHAPVGIYWKRADLGEDFHFNPTFRRILDLPMAASTDHNLLFSLAHPEEAAQLAELNQRTVRGEIDSYNIEARFVLKDQRVVWSALSVAVIRDERSRIVQDIGILEDITARKDAERKLAQTYKELVEASRRAGMAEVATGVLHNVGNVLNSLNVSAGIIASGMRKSKAENLVKFAAMMNDHAANLGVFLTSDPKGKLVPDYLNSLAKHSVGERDWLLKEIASMQKNIDHIKDIVTMQQTYATAVGVTEEVDPASLFEDALHMNASALTQHEVNVVREFQPVPRIRVEKAKVLQILTNLIRNAKCACDDAKSPRSTMVVRVEAAGSDRVRLIVQDNGIGIPAENLTRIFAHGFTTRSSGHGFGLHASAIAAKEMNGSLAASSDGPGRGATFTLELPLAPRSEASAPSGRGGLAGGSRESRPRIE